MRNNRWITPVVVVVLLVAFGALTALSPGLREVFTGGGGGAASAPPIVDAPAEPLEPEEVVIEPSGYLLGEELATLGPIATFQSRAEEERTYSSLTVLAIITALVFAGVVVFTVPVAALVVLGARSTTSMQEDDSYQKAANALENREKERLKALNQSQPANPVPVHERPLWSAWSTGMVAVLLAYFLGLAIGAGAGEGLAGSFAAVFAAIAAVVSFLYLRPQRVSRFDDSSNDEPNWSIIWIIISGAIVMGIGLGLMYIVIGGGNPFSFFMGS